MMSFAASCARVRRLGGRSLAIMLREVSIAIMRFKVRPLLGDLVSKLNGLAAPSLDSGIVGELVTGTRPIVNELFVASGAERP